ncbi:uncharacterized protein ZBAI_03947 [Zygosaccharomyces bailii ISA1307]|nr:uncharacterized protein ZBAI_03947 [Zygosaccharomyces bailii ISA1307]
MHTCRLSPERALCLLPTCADPGDEPIDSDPEALPLLTVSPEGPDRDANGANGASGAVGNGIDTGTCTIDMSVCVVVRRWPRGIGSNAHLFSLHLSSSSTTSESVSDGSSVRYFLPSIIAQPIFWFLCRKLQIETAKNFLAVFAQPHTFIYMHTFIYLDVYHQYVFTYTLPSPDPEVLANRSNAQSANAPLQAQRQEH